MSDLEGVTPGQERLGRATPGKERLFGLPSNKRNLTPSERARGNPRAVAPSQLGLRNILKSLESESVRESRGLHASSEVALLIRERRLHGKHVG
jgi:hypothetical protein